MVPIVALSTSSVLPSDVSMLVLEASQIESKLPDSKLGRRVSVESRRDSIIDSRSIKLFASRSTALRSGVSARNSSAVTKTHAEESGRPDCRTTQLGGTFVPLFRSQRVTTPCASTSISPAMSTLLLFARSGCPPAKPKSNACQEQRRCLSPKHRKNACEPSESPSSSIAFKSPETRSTSTPPPISITVFPRTRERSVGKKETSTMGTKGRAPNDE
mmetsp:Transcript_78472/g.156963  ORF Transcript_78472/g.156963 Transcript_78472/m.156963 type:complete len:216 (+) Transcript_78472:435-1082(+)